MVASRRPEILVVDDERPPRELLASLFEAAGFRVRAAIAINGRDALTQIEQASPDLIVMDLMMPVMGGAELYRRLKRGAATCAIPVIVMSAGLPPPSDFDEADTFVAKPFDLAAVEIALSRYLLTPWWQARLGVPVVRRGEPMPGRPRALRSDDERSSRRGCRLGLGR